MNNISGIDRVIFVKPFQGRFCRGTFPQGVTLG